jgi:segregation and condensation protein A
VIEPADLAATAEADAAPAVRDAFRVSLPNFEGPLDLLLHLLKEHQIDILDIPVSLITLKYLEHLDAMREIHLDIAGEFLVMAATLIHLKSRMLLPPEEKAGAQEPILAQEEGDPRADLVRRLLEYQKYRDAASRIASQGLLGRDVFPRAVAREEVPLEEGELGLSEVSVFKLIEALDRALAEATPGNHHQVTMDRFSLVQTMRGVALALRASVPPGQASFYALLTSAPTRAQIVGTFLAILELCKMRVVRVTQTPGADDLVVAEVGSALEVILADQEAPTLKELDGDYR